MRDMTAAHTEQEMFDVVVDVDGGVWVRTNGLWDYIRSANGLTGYDRGSELPKHYEPYNAVNSDAARFILRALATKVGA